ncbi:TRAP dicarboxylate transporter, DctP subunit [Desulfofundulus kuznetsovii DSM 6115]|uniref:TRAP dicarboxylate transporter, DctP subunit n=1 Tax=Desulfofundulus kuznetsovii (strain DSM 6115 / VKM B-1805 / 17) TaxID=760568 RepID=A0AAU8PMV1_DESK7|nr:TRAP dicarboxylate transporter, DctP subunit [Desulfofundulus kuznetsovii DSM 6115]
MKIKGILTVIALFLLSVLVAGCGSGDKKDANNAGGQKASIVTLKLAHTSAPDTAIYRTYEKFAQLVEEKSKGSIKVQVFPNGQLGGDQQTVEQVKEGSIDICSSGTNNMAPFTNMFLFADLPYVFKSLDGVHKVYSGPIGEELKQKVESELNMKLLFFADPGSFRNVMNSKRPIKTPADMKGLKFRSAASPIEMATIEAFGAAATPVTWPETYMALEQKVVDGELQQFHWAVTANHQEVIKYVTYTGGIHAIHLALMNLDKFKSLTPEQQKAILDAAKEAQEYNFANTEKWNEELVQKVKEAGVQFYTPTEEEMKQWYAAGQKVWDKFKDQIDQKFLERVLEAQK